MVDKRRSIKSLQRELAKEKARIAKAQERARLTGELKELKRGQRPGVKFARRVGRQFVKGARTVGEAAIRQGQRIAEEQRRERVEQRKVLKKQRPKPLKRKKISQPSGERVFVPGLGVVKRVPKAKPVKIKRRKKRRMRPIRREEDSGFDPIGSLEF